MQPAVDTSRTIEIASSALKLALLAVLGVIMTAGAAWVLTLQFGPGKSVKAWKAMLAGYIGVPLFGLATLVALKRLMTAGRPVVTITPTGITDTRVAAHEIPWAALEGISTWSYKGQKIIVLKVAPEVESGLGLSAIARITRRANTALGADGLSITAQGLKMNYQTLHATIVAYASAAHGKV